ncbi:MAG: rod shape-determining protein MreC [Patescibacteria group bacterium]
MKRRSISIRIVVVAVILFFATIALFTKILVPAERIVLDGLGSVVLGVHSFSQIVTNDAGVAEGTVRIIARRADEFQNTFIISASAPEGTKILSGDTLVGVVIAKGSMISKGEAISAPGFIVHGIISRSGVPAEFHGKGAMLLEARLPRGVDVQKGDLVMEDQGMPLGIGTVVEIIDSPSDPFITVIIQNPVNLYTLSVVELQEEAINTL